MVKYGGDTPSLRRGSVRVNPVRDGVIDPEAHTAYVRRMDWAGNKFRDVINPQTGFCLGANTVLTSLPNNYGPSEHWKPAVPGSVTRDTSVTLIKQVDVGNRRVYCENNRMVRTTDMGDSPVSSVPKTGVDTDSKPAKKSRTRVPRPVKPSGPDMSRVPGGTGPRGSVTESDVDAYLRAVMKGRRVAITDDMRKLARAALKKKRAKIARDMGLI